MKALSASRLELEQRLKPPAKILLCLDFDGTLAPFCDHPEDAALPERTRAELERLASAPGVVVAVISGRELGDLRPRVGVPGIVLAGNHGMEMEGRGFRFVHPGALARQEGLARLCDELKTKLREISGAELENKGLTATVHYRRAAPADHERIKTIVREAAARVSGDFEIRSGSMSMEIRPLVNWDKGAAVGMILARSEHGRDPVVYIGDDQTDEDAFAALRGHVTVKVGSGGTTAAEWQVSGPAEVADFLEWLCRLRSRNGA